MALELVEGELLLVSEEDGGGSPKCVAPPLRTPWSTNATKRNFLVVAAVTAGVLACIAASASFGVPSKHGVPMPSFSNVADQVGFAKSSETARASARAVKEPNSAEEKHTPSPSEMASSLKAEVASQEHEITKLKGANAAVEKKISELQSEIKAEHVSPEPLSNPAPASDNGTLSGNGMLNASEALDDGTLSGNSTLNASEVCGMSLQDRDKVRPCCGANQVELVRQKVDYIVQECKAKQGLDYLDCQGILLYERSRLLATEAGPVPGAALITRTLTTITGAGMGVSLFFSSAGFCVGFSDFRDSISSAKLFPKDSESVKVPAQAAMTLMLPWFALGTGVTVGAALGPAAAQSPILLLAMAAPSVLQVMWAEAAYAQKSISELVLTDLTGLLSFKTPKFFMSKLQVVDAVSDGATAATALFLTNEQKARFTESFKDSFTPLRVVVSTFGLAGLLVASLFLATAAQLGLAAGAERKATSEAHRLTYTNMAADLAGFGGRDSGSEAALQADLANSLLGALSRSLCEGVLQLLLQGSLLMVVGVSLADQRLLLCSLLLSVFTSVRKAVEITAFVRRLVVRISAFVRLFLCIFTLALWALLALCCFRIVLLQLCPCHSWGLSTGCGILL